MANELDFHYSSSGLSNVYGVLTAAGGQIVSKTTGALMTRSAANWPNAAIPLSDSAAAYHYLGSVPANTPANAYTWEPYLQAGVSAALSDLSIGSTVSLVWNGSAECFPVYDSLGKQQVDMVLANGQVFLLLPNGTTSGGSSPTPPAFDKQLIQAYANYPMNQPFTENIDLTGWSEMLFMVKARKQDLDAASLVEIKLTNGGSASDGLILLNGAAPASPVAASDGSITNVSVTGGGSPAASWYVNLTATAMAQLANGQCWWEWAWWKAGVKQSYQGTGPFVIGQTLVMGASQP